MKQPKYNWLLFDADETLFDFHQSSAAAFGTAMQLHGVENNAERYTIYKGVNAAVWKEMENGLITQLELRTRRFRLFFEKMGLDVDPANFSRVYLEELVKHTNVLPGALDLLERLKADFRLAIITNGMKEVQRHRLKRTGLTPYFEVIVVSDEIGHSKPQAAFFDHTFQEIANPAKEKVLVIGDNINSDIRGGFDYGIDTCWYNPNGMKNGTAFKATFEIDRLADLEGLVFV